VLLLDYNSELWNWQSPCSDDCPWIWAAFRYRAGFSVILANGLAKALKVETDSWLSIAARLPNGTGFTRLYQYALPACVIRH
jgi:hypothetical protein